MFLPHALPEFGRDQTGNLLLLIADWHDPRVENTIMRFSSILFFSIGFLVALHIKEYRKTAFWRTKMLIPLFVVTLLIPLVSVIPPVEVPFIAFGTGMMMLTFTGSLIENHPYVIFMTSGNYRKMLTPCTESLEEREIWTSIGVRP